MAVLVVLGKLLLMKWHTGNILFWVERERSGFVLDFEWSGSILCLVV
jgi:hypothetical protein